MQVESMIRLSNTSAFSTFKLSEGGAVPNEVQVLRVGKFKHPKYGVFEITPEILAELKLNEENKVRGIDTAFDYFHDSDKEAAAWVGSLELRENGTELWALVEWTPTAAKKLAERELRYFSPDFTFVWKDPESGKTYNNVLFGGGLTNRPFVKEMKAIVASENKGDEMTELEQAQAKLAELEAANLKLSEDMGAMKTEKETMMKKMEEPNAEAEALKAQIAELQSKLAALESSNSVMMEEKKVAEAAKVLAEKETAFTLLLSEGKACVAQKDSFLKGDMNEFIKLAQPLNIKGVGDSGGNSDADKEDKILKLAEEKRKADPKLSVGDAISIAKKELK